jgi:hypothetical protein
VEIRHQRKASRPGRRWSCSALCLVIEFLSYDRHTTVFLSSSYLPRTHNSPVLTYSFHPGGRDPENITACPLHHISLTFKSVSTVISTVCGEWWMHEIHKITTLRLRDLYDEWEKKNLPRISTTTGTILVVMSSWALHCYNFSPSGRHLSTGRVQKSGPSQTAAARTITHQDSCLSLTSYHLTPPNTLFSFQRNIPTIYSSKVAREEEGWKTRRGMHKSNRSWDWMLMKVCFVTSQKNVKALLVVRMAQKWSIL